MRDFFFWFEALCAGTFGYLLCRLLEGGPGEDTPT